MPGISNPARPYPWPLLNLTFPDKKREWSYQKKNVRFDVVK